MENSLTKKRNFWHREAEQHASAVVAAVRRSRRGDTAPGAHHRHEHPHHHPDKPDGDSDDSFSDDGDDQYQHHHHHHGKSGNYNPTPVWAEMAGRFGGNFADGYAKRIYDNMEGTGAWNQINSCGFLLTGGVR